MKRIPRNNAAPFILVILSAIVRFALCARYVSGDETRILLNAIQFLEQRTLMPVHFNYPTLFSYLSAIPIGIGAMVLKLRGAIPALPFLLDLHAEDSLLPILPARLVSAVFGTLTVLVLFKIGEKCFDRETGLIAAVILGFSNMHSFYSGYAFPDATMTFFAACALYYSLSALESNSIRNYVYAGALAGLAAATKYNGAFTMLVIVFAHLVRGRGRRALTSIRYHGRIALGLGSFAGAFVLGSPGWILYPRPFWQALMYERRHMVAGDVYDVGIPYIQQIRVFWRWETTAAVLFALGLLYALYRRKRPDTVVLIFAAACFIFIGSLGKKDIHYLIFLFPALCLLAARFLHRAKEALSRAAPAFAGVLLICIALAWPAYTVLSQAAQQVREDNRWAARRWIYANIDDGARIVVDWAYLPKLERGQRRGSSMALWETPGRTQEDRPPDERSYTLIQLDYSTAFIERIEAEYLLMSSGCYDRYINVPAPPRSPQYATYHRLRDTYAAILFEAESHGWRLLKRFDAGKGPEILVYERTDESPSR